MKTERRMKNPPPNKPHWDAAKIVGVYCMVSLAWIYLSDSLVVLAVRDPDLIARISIYKGSVFVLITALLLFKLITGYARSLFASYQDLRTSEERFRSIMSLSPDVISIISEKGALVYNSPAAFAIHGYTDSEMAGRNTFELIHPEDQPGVSAAFDRLLKNPGESLSAQYRYLNKEGTYVWMEAVACNQLGNPLIDGIVSISRSIVDRKELEEKRLQAERNLSYSQKLESLGVLAGGIAHDFNNILTAVMGNISFAKKLIQTSRDPNEALERAEKASLRAAALARRLVVFAKGGNPVKSTVCLEKVLEETGALVLSGTNVKSTVDIPRPLHAVQADEGQIAQSFHNIIINAVQSMPGCQSACKIDPP